MDDETRDRIAALERHIDHLYTLLGQAGPYSVPQWTPPPGTPVPGQPEMAGTVSEAVMQFIRQDAPIRAIKQYRTETGAKLKDAKHAVDSAVRAYQQGLIR